jgi:hypothetical protein
MVWAQCPLRHVLGLTVYRAGAFMNTWNSELIQAGFNNHATGFITNIGSQVELQHPTVAGIYRATMAQQRNVQDPSQVLQKAREFYMVNKSSTAVQYNQPTLGYVVKWLSELGKTTELDGLLTYIDNHLRPTWENGGLYYPRNDEPTDAEGRWTHMDPFSGNSAIGYARLNVENGQKNMWDFPWTREDLASRPWVDGIDFSQGVDCLRGTWVHRVCAMLITLREWAFRAMRVAFEVRNLPEGRWAIYQRHGQAVTCEFAEGANIYVEANIKAGEEIDFVIIQDSKY